MDTASLSTKHMSFMLAGALLGAGFAIAASASADTGMGWRADRGNCNAEQHEAVEEAIEGKDYEAWKELMGDRGRITQVVTEENFNTFVKMHEAMEDGDYGKAAEFRKELGLGQRPQDGTGYRGNGQHKGWDRGMGVGTRFGR
jgi:hypothetical protein